MFRKGLFFCFVLILMGSMDWLTTVVGIVCFGAVEVNPLFASLTQMNIFAFSVVKLLTVVLIGSLFYKAGSFKGVSVGCSSFSGRVLDSGYFASLVLLSFVVTNNAIAIARVI
jgi:hypothetical protein